MDVIFYRCDLSAPLNFLRALADLRNA